MSADNPIYFIDKDGNMWGPNEYAQFAIETYYLKQKNPTWSDARIGLTAYWHVVNGTVHTLLDVGGMVPLIGEVADGINGGLYLIEGNKVDAGLSFAGMVPIAGWFATGTKWVKNGIKVAMDYGDEAAAVVQQTIKKSEDAKEIFTITKSGSFKDAKIVVKDKLGDLGDDAVDYISETGKGKNPFYGKVVGKQSSDGSKYWRVDWSEADGAHVNWVNGKQKGSIPITGGLEQAKRIIENGATGL